MQMKISDLMNKLRFCLIKLIDHMTPSKGLRRLKPFIGLVIIFSFLLIPQCITVPVIYETTETKDEKRIGISAQYGEGSYSLCGSSYNYKYGGIRADYGYSRKQGNIVESGFELGGSINGVYETSSGEQEYKRETIMFQFDGRLTGKIVTPTNPIRVGIKLAPGFLIYGGISRLNGKYEAGGEIAFLSYGALLLGIGSPEFLTIGYSYYPYGYYFIPPYYSFLTLSYHHKKYSITASSLFPLGEEESEIPKFHYSIGLGIHY